ncbi:MAG TPA: pseudouridine synthase [Bdellovibrio sp.]|nr:pseudouridine synthase [Bdellovibrio sp.]
MNLLYQDEHCVAIDKPSGFHVHPPEDSTYRVPREKICLYQVRNLLNKHIYPVHRLDAATSGVLLFALSSAAAKELCFLFSERQTQKTYHAVARGFLPSEGQIQVPLELDSTGTPVDALTSYHRLQTIELPVAVGKKFPTARYSLMEVQPHTGRYHQIRRHFNRISHPLLGDAYHGDSHHNAFFRNRLGIAGLCLKATRLEFHPSWSSQKISIEAPECDKWRRIQFLFDPENAIEDKLKSL